MKSREAMSSGPRRGGTVQCSWCVITISLWHSVRTVDGCRAAVRREPRPRTVKVVSHGTERRISVTMDP